MAEPPVVNTTPIVILNRVGLLDWLRLAGDPILVPLAVAQEIRQRGVRDPAAQALAGTVWLQIVDPGPVLPVIQAARLGDGESAVLTWAIHHPGTEALLDDLVARRCAAALGIAVRGTVGLVITAKQRGLIPAARPVLETLRRAGLYLSDRILNQALAQVGE